MLGIICEAFATGEISSENSKLYDFPTIPLSTKPVQNPIPFWYPGSPITAGRHGMNLMWPVPIDQAAHDLYVETWNVDPGDTHRVDGPDPCYVSAAPWCWQSVRRRASRSTSFVARWVV